MRSDEELVEKIASGDTGALTALYDRYGQAAYSLALRILADAGRAEDVVQDTFLNVWRKAGTYERLRGTVRSWLLAMVHHRAVDLVRKQRREYSSPITTAADSLTGSSADVVGSVLRQMEHGWLHAAINSLPPDQLEALQLAFFGGYTHREIAERLGLPLGTVKGRIRVAMKKLRSAMAVYAEIPRR